MKTIYIREVEETCDIIKRIIIKIEGVLNIIKVKNIDGKTIYYLPIFKDSKISKYRIKKLSNKIDKLLEKDGVSSIALSEYLDKNEIFKNYLYSHNINILDGRFLYKCLIHRIIEYICKIRNKKMG